MPIDCTPDLATQAFCTRLFCWPCQTGVAATNAVLACDILGLCKTIWCCPCRTFCGWCPTQAETDTVLEEPEEIPYERVFEMEKRKRQIMMNAQTH